MLLYIIFTQKNVISLNYFISGGCALYFYCLWNIRGTIEELVLFFVKQKETIEELKETQKVPKRAYFYETLKQDCYFNIIINFMSNSIDLTN